MPEPNKTALTLFMKLADTPLDASNHGRWFYDLYVALAAGDVWSALFQKDSSGARPARPSTSDFVRLQEYENADKQASVWIAIAAGYSWNHITRPFREQGNGVGMYDQLRSQFVGTKPTMRYYSANSLFQLRLTQKPVVGTNWTEECRAIDGIVDDLIQSAEGMSTDDFIRETALHTLMRMLPNGDQFQQRLIHGLDKNDFTYQTAKEALIKHALVKSTNQESSSSMISHANVVVPVSPLFPPTGQAPSPDDVANAIQSFHCKFCGGNHKTESCFFMKRAMQEAHRHVQSKKAQSQAPQASQGPSFRYTPRNNRRYPPQSGTYRQKEQANHAAAVEDDDSFFDVDVEIAGNVQVHI